MGQASPVVGGVFGRQKAGGRPPADFRFHNFLVIEPESRARRGTATFFVSLTLHSILVLAVAVLPLLLYDAIPGRETLKAFFVSPLEIAPAPPPPPPPPAGARSMAKAPPRVEAPAPTGFVAPMDVPAEIRPEEGLSLGVEGGVPGGVEGGVPGGVVGGVVGGLPTDVAPPSPVKVVRIGGQIVAPKVVRRVQPLFPDLAAQARISATVILEAQVDTHGVVKTVRVLRGRPLFDQAAEEAVKQWRYQPLLLNGEPTEFILTVTVSFNILQQR